MQIVKTLDEVRSATIGLDTVSFLIQKKKDHKELHSGYTHLLNIGRQYGKKIMLAFMYPHVINDCATELKDMIITPIHDKDGNFNSHFFEWDHEGCTAWAEKQGVDVLWIPDYNDEIYTIKVPKFDYYKALLNNAWKTEKYDELINQSFINDRARAHCLGRLTADADWKYIGSWKDGIYMFVLAHFTNKYTKSRYILTDPIKTPDGIYYSSSYLNYTAKEKEILAKIEPTVRSFNFNNDLGVLKDNLDAFCKDIDLNIMYLNSYTHPEIIGPKKRVVYVQFNLRGEGQDIYSFILK